MARLIVVLVVAAVVFTVFSIIDCAVQPATRHRGVSKGWWIVITCVPVIGGLLWFLIGRGRGASSRQAPRRAPVAPDDDPRFLGGISQAEQDERIRQLEEELLRLEAEEDAERARGAGTARGADADKPDPHDDGETGEEPTSRPGAA